MANETLTFEFREHRQRSFDGCIRWLRQPSHPQVDDIQRVEPEVAEIVMNSIDYFLTRKGGNPGLVCAATSAHLGDDHQAVWIRMKRPLDNLIGHMRTVVVARVDVIDV